MSAPRGHAFFFQFIPFVFHSIGVKSRVDSQDTVAFTALFLLLPCSGALALEWETGTEPARSRRGG